MTDPRTLTPADVDRLEGEELARAVAKYLCGVSEGIDWMWEHTPAGHVQTWKGGKPTTDFALSLFAPGGLLAATEETNYTLSQQLGGSWCIYRDEREIDPVLGYRDGTTLIASGPDLPTAIFRAALKVRLSRQ
jgi:hypothetical protein